MERLHRKAPALLLASALALAAAVTLILDLAADLTYFGDTWEMLMNRRDLSADALLPAPQRAHRRSSRC